MRFSNQRERLWEGFKHRNERIIIWRNFAESQLLILHPPSMSKLLLFKNLCWNFDSNYSVAYAANVSTYREIWKPRWAARLTHNRSISFVSAFAVSGTRGVRDALGCLRRRVSLESRTQRRARAAVLLLIEARTEYVFTIAYCWASRDPHASAIFPVPSRERNSRAARRFNDTHSTDIRPVERTFVKLFAGNFIFSMHARTHAAFISGDRYTIASLAVRIQVASGRPISSTSCYFRLRSCPVNQLYTHRDFPKVL